MAEYDLIVPENGKKGDFAVRLEDDSLAPLFRAGEVVYLRRSTDLSVGDFGLFRSVSGMVFRQFCQDSEGNIYLFSPDRSRREADIVIPRNAPRPVCYGLVVLDEPVPLPDD